MLDVCAERGAANVTVTPVVERAGVSRRTFYELFADSDECLLAAIDKSIDQVACAVASVWNTDVGWRERVRAALVELLTVLDDDLVTGRLLVVDTLGAGRDVLERRAKVLAHAIAAIDEGRDRSRSGTRATPLAAEGVVGAVMSVLHARFLEGTHRPLLELTAPLMSMIVLPYLGPAAAARELERSAPARPKRKTTAPNSRDPLREVNLRLTHRTVLVLGAIADSPGASNRQVGRMAGIEDQGQISKLLSRLERLGLIRNDNGEGFPRGKPNAWELTEQGERVQNVISPARQDSPERWYGAALDAG